MNIPKPKTALITGVTGQDGACLAEDTHRERITVNRVHLHDALCMGCELAPLHACA